MRKDEACKKLSAANKAMLPALMHDNHLIEPMSQQMEMHKMKLSPKKKSILKELLFHKDIQ